MSNFLSEHKMFLQFYIDCTFVVFENWSTLCCNFTLLWSHYFSTSFEKYYIAHCRWHTRAT